MTDTLFTARDISKKLGGLEEQFTVTIENVSLYRRDCIAMVGPSGCGKSTMLALMALALQPDDGAALRVAGVDALDLWRRRRLDALGALRGRAIGFVPQTFGLLPFLSLRGNIGLPLAITGEATDRRIEQLADRLDISAALDRRPADVSVGQRQRAAIARAVIHRPAVLFADEPTASVHPVQARTNLDLLVATARDAGAALLIATHDSALAEACGLTIMPINSTKTGSRFACAD